MIDFNLLNANLTFFNNFYSPKLAEEFLISLKNEIEWKQNQIKMFGKIIDEPRLSAWYGDNKAKYSYSGINLTPQPWTSTLLSIKNDINKICDTDFNSVLLNYYRNGKDYMGWHADDEKELGLEPVIASISFGAIRSFQLRRRDDKTIKQSIELNSGSLLLMSGQTQQYWQHQLPKRLKVKEGRINLTFREIKNI